MTYEQLEQSIVTRIAVSGAGYQAKLSAATDDQFDRPVVTTTAEVMYHSSVFPEADFGGRPGSMVTDVIEQQEYARVAIMVRGKALRGNNGVLAALSAIRRLLVGFRPAGAQTGIALSKVELTGREDGIWYYTMLFGCSVMLMEDVVDEPGTPLLEVTVDVPLTGEEWEFPPEQLPPPPIPPQGVMLDHNDEPVLDHNDEQIQTS